MSGRPEDWPSFLVQPLNNDNEALLNCSKDEEREQSILAMNVWARMHDSSFRTDSVLRSDNGPDIKVHRNIMAASSPYFYALYNSSLNTNPDRNNIKIPGITYDLLWRIVHFAYTGIVLITEENASRLLPAADQFNMVKMVESCCDFILNRMTPENCIGFRNFAKEFFCKRLLEESQKYLMSNFMRVAEVSEEMLELIADDAIALFGAEKLNASNEKYVWEAIIKWIKREPEARKKHIVELLKCVRLGLMDSHYFIKEVKTNEYVVNNEMCRPLIIETMRFIYDLQDITSQLKEVPTPLFAIPRIPNDIMFTIGGWSEGQPTNIIESYDTRADRWIRITEIEPSGVRAYHKCAVIGFDIYVIGGFNGSDYFNSCKCFNAVTKIWREIAPMSTKRCYVSTAVLRNLIYSIGGYDGHHRQNTAEKYDYITNQWTNVVPMNAQRSDACATSLSGIIYITGGFNGTECLSSCECYNPDENAWHDIVPMRIKRSGMSCIAYDEHIYALGGFNGISRLQSGEKYSPEADQWTLIPDMYNPRSNFAIEVMDDMIFVSGGFNGLNTINHVECFDRSNNEWFEATDMCSQRSALSACVVKGLPNISDYIHQNRDNLMEEKRQMLLQMRQNARNNRRIVMLQQNQQLQQQQQQIQQQQQLQRLDLQLFREPDPRLFENEELNEDDEVA